MNNDKLINYEETKLEKIDINDTIIIKNIKNSSIFHKGILIYIEENIITLTNNIEYTDYDVSDFIIYKKMWDKNRKMNLIKDFQNCIESNKCKFIKKKEYKEIKEYKDNKEYKEKIYKKKIIDFSLIEKLEI